MLMKTGGNTALDRLEAISRVRPLTVQETQRLIAELRACGALEAPPENPVEVRRRTLADLECLSRLRALHPSEQTQLERFIRAAERKGQRPWTKADVLRLQARLRRGDRPKAIAADEGRTERAVWTKMWRMGWRVKGTSLLIINPEEGP